VRQIVSAIKCAPAEIHNGDFDSNQPSTVISVLKKTAIKISCDRALTPQKSLLTPLTPATRICAAIWWIEAIGETIDRR
jgi:hypothetical protein